MRNSIANYKESLSRIASDVLDAAAEEELDAAGSRSGQASPPSARRSSRRASLPASPRLPNGASPDRATEMEQYKAEIERLQISEAEIKALAINYAAILKEKEAHLSRLHEENNVLRKSLDAKSGPIGQVSDENSKPTKNSSIPHKANQSPSKQQKITTVVGPLSPGSSSQKNAMVKADTFSNGGTYTVTNTRATQTQKDLETLLEENNRNWTGIHAKHESEIKELMFELKNEREISVDYKLKYSDEQRRSSSFQKDIHDLKLENERTSAEIKDLQNKLAGKMSEIGQMQAEISRLNTEKVSDETLQNLQTSIALLQEENKKLKLEKERLTAASELAMENNVEAINNDNLESLRKLQMSNKETEDLRMTIQELEKTLKETCSERDKAQKELARLKQHLLDKDLEESEKMDEDNKIIDELRAISEHQKVHIMKLEKALRQEIAKYEEARNTKADEIRKLNETIDDLNKKLLNYMTVVDSKNGELLNLQTALGQYYAESEAKERLERDLAAAKEESVKLSDSLKVALQDCQLLSKEKEDMFSKVSQAEKMLSESKRTIQKLQEDNSKLHRAVEQSVTRINRMSMDSDFSVDRRIVIKLLVTYFQRNHSKEVLDLMVRMLGFSDEDKQRIGFAQQNAGKSAVRGVLGLPGRLVGGMLGGKTSISSEASSENQSFADLWVDFLLKETEQRERRESGPVDQSSSIQDKAFSATAMPTGSGTPDKYNASTQHPTSSPLSSPSERPSRLSASDMEFATVPLTSSAFSSSETNTRLSRFLQR